MILLLRRVAKARGTLALLEQGVYQTLQIGAIAVVGHAFGVEQVGILTGVVGVTSILNILLGCGLQMSVARAMATGRRNARAYYAHAIVYRMLIALPASVVLAFLGKNLFAYSSIPDAELLGYVIHGALLGHLTFTLRILQAADLYKEALVYHSLLRLGLLLSALAAAIASVPFSILLSVWNVTILAMLIAGHACVHGGMPIGIVLRIRFAKRLIASSIPLATASLLETINMRVAGVIVMAFASLSDAALFNAAFVMFAASTLPVTAVGKVFMQRLTYAVVNRTGEGWALLRRFVFGFVVYGIGGGGGLWIAAPHIAYFCFGSESAASGELLRLWSVGLPFLALSRLGNYMMIALNMRKAYMATSALALCACCVGTYLLVPGLGPVGGVMAMILGDILLFGVLLVVLKVPAKILGARPAFA